MSDKSLPFVITDRRKFNPDGQPRESTEAPAESPAPVATPEAVHPDNIVEMPTPAADLAQSNQSESGGTGIGEPEPADDDSLPEAPTAEQMEQSRRAFEATADRLDTAVRAANPGADHPPALSFESVVQSVYMQAVMQLGGGPQQGEQGPAGVQIDILGARQSIDMLGILAARTAGNLSKVEDVLLSSALFELRLAFLEMTQALARSAQQRGPNGPGGPGGMPPAPGGRPGPSIVR